MKLTDNNTAENLAAAIIARRNRVCNVRWHGASTPAYADDGRVYVMDDVAGHYTTCHNLTEGQRRYVMARANRSC